MPWRGITKLINSKTVVIIDSKVKNPSTPTWIKTTIFDRKEDGSITPAWKKLVEGKMNATELIKNLGDTVRLFPIDGIVVNNNTIHIKDLYNYEGQAMCIFKTEVAKDATVANIRSLYIVGSKTVNEIQKAGYTKRKESFLPLIICLGKSISLLNSL